METDNRLSYFFLGLGIGVAVGVLFAPKSGKETRGLIKSKATEGGEYLKSKATESGQYLRQRGEELRDSATDYVERGRTALNRQRDQINAAMEAGKAAYRDVVSEEPKEPGTAEGV